MPNPTATGFTGRLTNCEHIWHLLASESATLTSFLTIS
jgi:hypothetical protein